MEAIIDNSGDKSYFTQICNFVDDLDLSIVAFRLYAHYKRVSGEKGKKAKVGVRTLAKKFKVGFETIQKAKKELIDHKLIIVQSFPAKENRPDEVEIIDVWHRNFEHFSKPQPVSNKEQGKKKPVTKQKQVTPKPVTNEEQPRSYPETPPVSPQEQKNNLSKELEEEISLTAHARDWQYPVRELYEAFPDLELTPGQVGSIEADVGSTEIDKSVWLATIKLYKQNHNPRLGKYMPDNVGTLLAVFSDRKRKEERNAATKTGGKQNGNDGGRQGGHQPATGDYQPFAGKSVV